MILGGLWHGAAWTYMLWGAYQGALLMVFRSGAEWLVRRPQAWLEQSVGARARRRAHVSSDLLRLADLPRATR